MNKTFGLVSDAAISDFVNFVNPIWRKLAKEGTPIIVKISTKSEEITSAQRRLYFTWCGQFAKHFGDDKDSVHLDMKRRFLIAIYRQDDAGFAAMCDAIAKLKDSEPDEYEAIGKHVIKLTSITKATKSQMSELLDNFFRFSVSKGLYLTCPDDLKFIREMKGD